MMTAMVCAGAVTAQFVGGKATRDALFLASLNYTALPTMVIATSVFSIVLVGLNSRAARSISPSTLVPISFAVSGAGFLLEWLLTSRAPAPAAVIVYLHISGIGPLLGSGFWLISSERFDPRTAKRRFGQIAAAGTLGGLLSALLAEHVAALLGVAFSPPFIFSAPGSAAARRRISGSGRPGHGRRNVPQSDDGAEPLRPSRDCRGAVSALSSAPRAARHDQHRASRLYLQGRGRERLWPFLEDRRPVARSARARDEILADLLRSNHSIMLNLEELRRRAGVSVSGPGAS